MGAAPIQLVVRLDAGPDADDEELAGLALRLRDDLQQLDEASVELAREGTPPPGAKSGDPVEWGTLIVSAVTSGALSAVLKTAQAWLARRRGSSLSVKIGDDELVLTGASPTSSGASSRTGSPAAKQRRLPMADGRYALIVASSRYSDATLTQLEAPVHDARSLATVLSTPAIGDFDVTTLADEPASKVMQEIKAFFDGRRREDLVLLYFSGHGILDESARLYFATTDTRVDRPRSTAVSANFVNDLMSECRPRRQVLMLDCCNSGAFARGIKAGGTVGTGERFEGRGRVVITASDALQYAFEAGRVEGACINSVFTRALVDGLETGDADLNGDGRVTLDELYDYVYGRVLDASPRQRPHKWAFGVEGQIFIARTTAPAAQPTPPPERPPAETAPAAHAPKTPRPRKPLLRRPLVWGAPRSWLPAQLP
jgi:hypothetical protein